jgi:hypothetical protein
MKEKGCSSKPSGDLQISKEKEIMAMKATNKPVKL